MDKKKAMKQNLNLHADSTNSRFYNIVQICYMPLYVSIFQMETLLVSIG